jgi:arginase
MINALCKFGQKLNGVQCGPVVLQKYIESFEKRFIFSNVNVNGLSDYTKLMNIHKTLQNPITIGGDHSIAMSTIGSSLQKYKNLKVVWVDAHSDINTPESSLTNNIHGMPLSVLMGNSNLIDIPVKLKKENLTYIGIRDLDAYEKNFIENENISLFTSSYVQKYGIHHVVEQMNITENDTIHLSIDVDVIDPSIFKATGTPVQCGISPEHINLLIQYLKPNIVSSDIVEYNPLISDLDSEKAILYKFIRELTK